jgi:ComF family protein
MTTAGICGRCLRHDFSYDFIIAPLRYESTLRYLITQLKFHQKLACANLFSTLIMKALAHDQNFIKPEILLAVPLHTKRICYRGFNQALEIAKPLAAALQIPLHRNLLYKKQASLPQSALNFKQRETNLRNIFALRYPIQYRHVGLVDDVVTTGNTVNEVAKLLKAQGVKCVSVFAVARTVLS